MAKLAAFRTDSAAIREGEWVRVEEYGDLDILTRGFNDQYQDAQAMRQRRAAASFGGDTAKIPAAIRRQINVECIIAHIVRDVRNLEDDGRPIEFPEFCNLLRDPDYEKLVVACLEAAATVGRRKQIDLDEVAAPLAPASDTPSNGAASPS